MSDADANPFENLMIQASAGSGKTHDLVGRYLRLLDTFEKPQAIVALTFTRKAAGEFFDRILGALAEAAQSDSKASAAAAEFDVPTLTRQRALQLLRLLADNLHQLSLGTLDGFYARVLRAFPAEFGVTADYEVLDEVASKAAQREVLDGVLGVSDSAASEAFLDAFRLATFGSEEKNVLTSLEDYVQKFHARFLGSPASEVWGDPSRIWPQGEWWLAEPKRKDVDAALKALSSAADDFEAETKPRKALANAVRSLVKTVNQVGIGFIPATLPKFSLNLLAALDGIKKRTVSELAFHGKSTVEVSGAFRDALLLSGHWILWCEMIAKLRQTRGVRDIVSRYEAGYDQQVRRMGRLGFDDVLAVLAGVAPVREMPGSDQDRGHFLLSMDADAGTADEDREAHRLLVDYRLDAQFHHWLIDEFQDTSRRQWQVLRNLIDEVMFDDSGERSFYYVGDVKQAIFGWRGGDSRLFDEVRRRYAELPEGRRIEVKKLDNSWRSGPVILNMVNRIFGDRAALAELVGEDHRAVIDDRWSATWRDHESNKPKRVGYARWVTVKKPADAGRSLPGELRWKTVLGILEELRPVENRLQCAVLVRKGKVAHELADYVRQHSDIPVMVEGRMAVGVDHPVGTSFSALLQWAAHPGDTRSWVHVKMTPPLTSMSNGELSAFRRTVAPKILKMLHDHGFGEAFDWWATQLRKSMADGGIGDFAEHRCEQIAEACRHFDETGDRSVDDFLQYLAGYEAADVPARGTVQLMTIHKAKGLTFDAVIIADIEGDGITTAGRRLGVLSDSNPEWLLMRPKKDLALAVEPLCSAYRQAEMDAAFEELCNLYVALTRAKHANYVVSSTPSSSGGCAPTALLQATLVDADPETIEVDGVEIELRYEDGDPCWLEKFEADEEDVAEVPAPRPTVTAGRKFPQRRRRLPSGDADGRPFGDAKLWFAHENAQATGFGTAVHALFECITWLDATNDTEREKLWSAALVGFDAFAGKARDEVERSLNNEEIRALFERPASSAAAAAQVWLEKRFEMIVGDNEWVSGVFDRVNLFADRAQIIDFKTNRVETDEEIDDAVDHYRSQMQTYRVALARLTGLAAENIECLLVFTRPGRVERIGTAEVSQAKAADLNVSTDIPAARPEQGEFDL